MMAGGAGLEAKLGCCVEVPEDLQGSVTRGRGTHVQAEYMRVEIVRVLIKGRSVFLERCLGMQLAQQKARCRTREN
jgi:hypothetical protein